MVRTWKILASSLLSLIFLVHATAGSNATSLLQPPDTSSPRATLKSFFDSIDEAFSAFETALLSYRASKRLYFSPDEKRLLHENSVAAARAIECLDLSKVPANIRGALSHEEAIFLLEILHRIPLPDLSSFPDREAMLKSGKKRWRIPGTRIEISLIEQGPRAGEYLFSASTVAQVRAFYHQVKQLPYKPGSVRRVAEVYKSQGFGNGSFYQAYLDSPIRLADVVPYRWIAALPRPVKADIAGMALWKWLTLMAIALICAGGVWIVYYLERKARTAVPLAVLATPLVIALAGKFFQDFATTKIRIGETALTVVGAGGTLITFVALAAALFLSGVVIGDGIVRSQRMRSRSMDAQLIRLLVRLVGMVGATALLIECASRLGIPAYSVLAGLGIGGLAVALAAQDSLANLFASIIIMFEKPFRVGQWIKVGTNEGIVERVGFRSTRIRTFHDSLISIPNSDVVKTSIDNLGAREKRRQRFFLQIKYDTPPERVDQFVSEIRRLIEAHDKVDTEKHFIHFNNLGESALEILLYFYLRVDDYAEELREREGILLRLLELAEEIGVTFAFPTRTLQLESMQETSEAASTSFLTGTVTSPR
ncbi:MAG TPA: mechanosensitive ion channel family protein [Hyphomicrobiaceae bacterium]|nr:mechanosensitive ion channel family protein [Hyphomicrobiaceae bacterium]